VVPSPVIWNKPMELLAKAYYAAEVLDVTELMHLALFQAIHVDGLRLTTVSDAGEASAVSLAFDDYPSVALLAAAVNDRAGWSSETLEDVPSHDLRPTAGVDAIGKNVRLTYPDQGDGTWHVAHDTGLVALAFDPLFVGESGGGTVASLTRAELLVQYRAGYETIPDDVALVCNELVAQAFHEGAHDPAVRSESLGDYACAAVDAVQLSADQLARLRPYMEVR
jgi:hypothetical protein